MLKIKTVDFLISANKIENYPVHSFDEIVFLGRSNVGKSTFINSLVNNKKIAYVSSKPGKTQLLNFFLINQSFCLVDVPGYGYAKVSKKQREEFGHMIEEFLNTRDNIKLITLLVDFKVGPTEDDILMYEFLKYCNHNVLVVATKKDKVKNSAYIKHKNNILKKMNLIDKDLFVYSKNDKKTLDVIYEYYGARF